MKKGSTMISEEYIISINELKEKFGIPDFNLVDVYVDWATQTIRIVDERHENPKKLCSYGHPIFVSRCSQGHKEDKK